MWKIIFSLVFLVVVATAPVFAAGGHDHGSSHGNDHGPATHLSKNQIFKKATGYVGKLVEKGQLTQSWQQVSAESIVKNDSDEWVVIFKNPQVSDPDQQTLYMFLTTAGNYIAANFTGK